MALFVLQPPIGGLFMNDFQEHLARVHELFDRLDRLRDDIGCLDDILWHDTDLIDNRGPHSKSGAYQLMGQALRRLEEYIWELKEAKI